MALLKKKISEKHQIDHLTENHKLSISCIREGKDVFIETKTGSGKSLSYESSNPLFWYFSQHYEHCKKQ